MTDTYIPVEGEWVPYLIDDDEVTKLGRVELPRRYMSRDEVSQFWVTMWREHPDLVGRKISFELHETLTRT